MSKHVDANAATSGESSATPWVWSLICLVIIGLISRFARMGAVSPRIANPEVTGVPRPVEFLFGYPHWMEAEQIATVIIMIILLLVCAVAWRRHPGHPYLLMTIASTAIVWLDPIMNWAPYAVYNPQLWHFPEDWPLVKMSPTVEPFVVIGYAFFYFGPFFPAIWILRRLRVTMPTDSFVGRRPLLSLAALILVIGFLFDMVLEVTMVRTGLYFYAQVIPWGSIFTGTTFQFPLIWESTFITFVMIPAGVLCYRDDTGRTVAEKLAQRLGIFRSRPALATFLVMFAILNLAYFMYGGALATIRAIGAATAVACPYPYPEAKVYDPQGYYEREGQPGPYFEGFWNIRISGHDARPQVNPLKPSPSCLPRRSP